jgi:hypothetical protein
LSRLTIGDLLNNNEQNPLIYVREGFRK